MSATVSLTFTPASRCTRSVVMVSSVCGSATPISPASFPMRSRVSSRMRSMVRSKVRSRMRSRMRSKSSPGHQTKRIQRVQRVTIDSYLFYLSFPSHFTLFQLCHPLSLFVSHPLLSPSFITLFHPSLLLDHCTTGFLISDAFVPSWMMCSFLFHSASLFNCLCCIL